VNERAPGDARSTRAAGPVRERVGQVRGVLAERIVVSTQLDPFLDLRALSAYSSLSVRKLRDLLEDPGRPLPCYQVGGKLLVRRSEFDAWVSSHRRRRQADVDGIVSDVLRKL
jgi:hypothetical protein